MSVKIHYRMANSADPIETAAHKELSHQDLHCLHMYLFWSSELKGIKISTENILCFFFFFFYLLYITKDSRLLLYRRKYTAQKLLSAVVSLLKVEHHVNPFMPSVP